MFIARLRRTVLVGVSIPLLLFGWKKIGKYYLLHFAYWLCSSPTSFSFIPFPTSFSRLIFLEPVSLSIEELINHTKRYSLSFYVILPMFLGKLLLHLYHGNFKNILMRDFVWKHVVRTSESYWMEKNLRQNRFVASISLPRIKIGAYGNCFIPSLVIFFKLLLGFVIFSLELVFLRCKLLALFTKSF